MKTYQIYYTIYQTKIRRCDLPVITIPPVKTTMSNKRVRFDMDNGPMLFSKEDIANIISKEDIANIIAQEKSIPLFCNTITNNTKQRNVLDSFKNLSLNSGGVQPPRKKSRFAITQDYATFFNTRPATIVDAEYIQEILQNEACFNKTEAKYWGELLVEDLHIFTRDDLLWVTKDELQSINMPNKLIECIQLWDDIQQGDDDYDDDSDDHWMYDL